MNSFPRMLTVSMPEKSMSEGSVMSCHTIKRVFFSVLFVFCFARKSRKRKLVITLKLKTHEIYSRFSRII